MERNLLWRALLFGGAVMLSIGGPRHPGGTMAEMLADPAWVPSHAWQLGGYALMLGAVEVFRRSRELPAGTARWARLAAIGLTLQVIEMVLHTVAYVDAERLVAGESTPVLTAHLAATVLFYPVFAATFIGLIVAGVRERTIGSVWIAPLGVLGLAAHGLAPIGVLVLRIDGARVLFPMVLFFALWCLAAAAWPRAAPRRAEAA